MALHSYGNSLFLRWLVSSLRLALYIRWLASCSVARYTLVCIGDDTIYWSTLWCVGNGTLYHESCYKLWLVLMLQWLTQIAMAGSLSLQHDLYTSCIQMICSLYIHPTLIWLSLAEELLAINCHMFGSGLCGTTTCGITHTVIWGFR